MKFSTFSKSFRGSPDGWINVCDTNFLVGENSTGKSSFLKLFKIIVSHDFQLRDSVYLRDRPDYNFDDFYSKLTGSGEEKDRSFEIGCIGARSELNAYVGKMTTFVDKSGTPNAVRTSLLFNSQIFRISQDVDSIKFFQEKIRKGTKLDGVKSALLRFHRKSDADLGKPQQIEPIPSNYPEKDSGTRELSITLKSDGPFIGNIPFIPDMVANVDHLGPIRARPGRVYQVGGDIKSIQGEESLDKLARANEDILSACNRFGKESGLFDKMNVNNIEELGPNSIVITFDKNNKTFFSEELGFGVGQIVPIIVEATRSRTNAILVTEQPELHLHPKAQSAFGKLMEQFAENGFTSIVETHSDHLLDRFRIQRAKRKQSQTSAQILFFYSGRKGNHAKSINIDVDGQLIDAPAKYRKFFLKEAFEKISVL